MGIQRRPARPADRESRLRQALYALRAELGRLFEVFVDREPITPGSVYELRRKCGKPSCRCANGTDLHACLVITWTAKGRKRLRSVPEGEQMKLQELTARYKLFRKARARLIAVHGKMLAIIDKKEEVPTWFFIASNVSMRLHGVHGFHSYPYVVRCGGMLGAFGPDVAQKTTHPETGDVTLVCHGLNRKNDYDRQTPCDQDYLRKFSRDTKPEALEDWFNGDVARLFKAHKLFDQEAGVWIGDASYVFVPDNAAYERSVRMLFDEHGHPVDSAKLAKMSPEAAARCQWRRCYKLVSLLYVDRSRDFYLRVAMRLVPGNVHECPIFYELLDAFVTEVGEGVIRRLVLDRGFIDGERIAHCKRDLGIDVLIPVRKDMDIYEDVLGLLKLKTTKFREYRLRAQYAIRTDIEEGHRQLKCFWDMTRFTSRAFSLVLNQIVFVLLAYNLLQIFLRAQSKPPLSRRSRPRQLDLAMTTAAVIIIYAENRFATLTPLEYTELLLTLGEEARKKILAKTRRLREELGQALRLARAP